MSKINELIKEMCPNGVEYKFLKDVSEMKRGQSITTKKLKVGKIPVIAGGQEPAFYNDKYNREGETITISSSGAYAGFLNYWNEPILCTDSFSIKAKKLNMRYLYHYLKMKQNEIYNKKRGAGIPHVHISDLEKFKISCPPLEVQEEIVRILDKFGELEAELEAELEVRKNQYEFWRGKIINMYDSKNIKLSDMAKIYDGTHSTPNYQENGIPFISVENISNIYGTNKFISKEDYKKYKIKPEINDVFMTRIGTIGKCSVFEKQINLAYYVSLALIRPNTGIILPKYLKYVIESNIGKDELYKRTLVHAVPIKVNKDEIGKIVLPVPSIDDQKKIISKLDKFESLTESISSGLPAEIELRRQQYEYYRNKLLNFEVV